MGKISTADYNLAYQFPDIAKEWHPTKNVGLTPNDITHGSGKKVWWQCEKGHEWEAVVQSRTRGGSGCAACSGRKVTDDNNLLVLNPNLAKEWHPTKNGNLTPSGVRPGSNKKVWWQCEKGHEWEVTVSNRSTGYGCPYCAGQRPTEDNNLLIINPDLAKEWHPTKNGELTPNEVMAGSGKKVWWQCEKGHEWEAVISSRSRGHGCPHCYKEIRNR